MLTFQFDLLSKPIDPIQGSLYKLGAKVVIFFQKIISEGIKTYLLGGERLSVDTTKDLRSYH
ncbi:hypothetical protein CCAN12_810159 [Capnocytophaga canimorsus]|uniref:Uncharacterized protein n=1 Tax=Capnocytophaga canimorsus TaxID=28188 RepID=A0A0B7HW53_9FLAO|nr:hypothetical protein CCAN12_810159 [Capnocytophaga canimorsus]